MQQNKLYVSNLAFSSTQSDVEAAFSAYGNTRQIRLVVAAAVGVSDRISSLISIEPTRPNNS